MRIRFLHASILFGCAVCLVPLTVAMAMPPAAANDEQWHQVANSDCTSIEQRSFLMLGDLARYSLDAVPSEIVPEDSSLRWIAYGEYVVFEFTGLRDKAQYEVRMTFLSEISGRKQRVTAGEHVLTDELTLPEQDPITHRYSLPQRLTRDGMLRVAVESLTGPNAVVSSIQVWSDDPQSLEPAKLPDVETPRLSPRPANIEGLSSPRISLDGSWHFHPGPPDDFFTQTSVTGWHPFDVPGEWVMQGFEVEPDTSAGFMRRFTIPPEYKGKRLKLRFDAVYSRCTVWVNGIEVGSHTGGFTPFELDITRAATIGENWIALRVVNESVADVLASGSQYAVHQLGGITRSVELFAANPLNLSALVVTTHLDDAYEHAVVRIDLELANEGDADIDESAVIVQLHDPAGKAVASADMTTTLPPIAAGQRSTSEIELDIKRPLLWDTEHPNLYTLSCTLAAPGQPECTIERRIGIRLVEVKGHQLLLNGRPVKLRGINRHEAHPLRGRSLTPGMWHRDAELFRDANINFIRTSHYPPAEAFLDACDQLGLLVECEAPLCWVQVGVNQNWTRLDWHKRYLSLFRHLARANLENVIANRHHPSIIMWSLANESRWTKQFARVHELVRDADPTRPTVFHDQCWGTNNNGNSKAVIANMHYPGLGWSDSLATESRPVLFGEYCHLNAYNRHELAADPGLRDMWGLALSHMWELMYNSKGCLGGAIWSGVDDAFVIDNEMVGYGSWGPVDGWRRHKPEYWHIKKTYSPIRVLTEHIDEPAQGQSIQIRIANRYDFAHTGELDIRWSVNGQSGTLVSDISPRSQGTLTLPADVSVTAGDAIELTFDDPRGFTAQQVCIPVGASAHASIQTKNDADKQPLQFEMTQKRFDIRQGSTRWTIHRNDSNLEAHGRDGSQIIAGGPRLMILPVNSSGVTQLTGADEAFTPYTPTCQKWSLKRIEHYTQDNAVVLTIAGEYDEAAGSFELRFDHQGMLAVRYDFAILEDIAPRQIGIVFDLPRSFAQLAWQRQGQWTSYPADHIGRLTGQAHAFGHGLRTGPAGPISKPQHAWASDWTALGSHDFRSTKTNIERASLANRAGLRCEVLSDGSQHIRAWVEDGRVRLLIADYSNLGGEHFLREHAARYARPLEAGDRIRGKVTLALRDLSAD